MCAPLFVDRRILGGRYSMKSLPGGPGVQFRWRRKTEVSEGSKGSFQKTHFVTFASFCEKLSSPRSERYIVDSISFRWRGPGQDQTGDSVLQHGLVEIHQQSDGDIQQLHVTEELRFAEGMHHFDRF